MGFKTRMQTMTGLTFGTTPCPDAARIIDILNEGARDVVNKIIKLDPSSAVEFSVYLDSANNALDQDIPSQMVLEVSREQGSVNDWRPCREIPITAIALASDPASLHEATKFSPVYYWEGQQIKIIPAIVSGQADDARVTYVGYPTLDDEDGPFASPAVSSQTEDLILIYTSYKILEAGLGTIREAGLPADLNLDTAPASPVMALATAVFPTYTAPANIVMPTPPVDADLDFSSLSAPSFTAPADPVVSEVTISFNEAAPVFTPPVMGSLDFASTEDLITNEEDPELLGARIQEINAKMAEYSALVQTANAEFNEENIAYQASLQTTLEQSRLDAQNETTKLQAFSHEFQNDNVKFQTDLSVWQQDINIILQTYQAETGYDLSRYTAQVNSTVSEFTNDLQLANTAFQNDIAIYNADIQDTTRVNQESLSAYGSELQEHASNIQSATQEFNLKLQKDITQYGWMQGQYVQLKQQYAEAFAMKAPQAGG